ncbi:unnamed protein product [[Candida] boidinii]|nr:unnamed protein product [[Candida] boidinii]
MGAPGQQVYYQGVPMHQPNPQQQTQPQVQPQQSQQNVQVKNEDLGFSAQSSHKSPSPKVAQNQNINDGYMGYHQTQNDSKRYTNQQQQQQQQTSNNQSMSSFNNQYVMDPTQLVSNYSNVNRNGQSHTKHGFH